MSDGLDIILEGREHERDPVVYKTIGSPGSGKTTRVVGNPDLDNAQESLVEENIREGYGFDDIYIVTYTKAGTEEAADRLYRMTDYPKYKIEDRVRTIHSACFQLIDINPDQVVQWWDKQKFCKQYDMSYGSDNGQDDMMAADQNEGNLFFDIYSWLQSNCKDKTEYEDCPHDWDGEWGYEFIHERWEEWKEDRNKIGYGDMIEKAVDKGRMQIENLGWGKLFPDEDTSHEEIFEAAIDDPQRDPETIRGKGAFLDTKVMFVDEVQDLDRLQWRWYMMQKLVCERVYIGGDDDQAVYTWSGADPRFMLNEEGDFEVLERTYRIPENIWEQCEGVIKQVDQRQEKKVVPNGDGGEFITYEKPSPRELLKHAKEGSVFILFRARYMIDEYTEKLHKQGIPYTNMSTFETWDDDIELIRDALAKVEKANDPNYEGSPKLSGDEVEVMKEYLDDERVSTAEAHNKTNSVLGNFSGISMDTVDEMFDLSSTSTTGKLTASNYLDLADDINHYQRQAIMGSIKRGTEDLSHERVKIGTIHSSKGKEAETVILCLDSTATIMEEMSEKTTNSPKKRITDAERRVYYVGMSRASKKLVLAQGAVTPNTTIQLRDLLAGYEPEPDHAQSTLTDHEVEQEA